MSRIRSNANLLTPAYAASVPSPPDGRTEDKLAPRIRRDVPERCPPRAAIVQALDMASEAVFFLNADLQIIHANAAAARDSGYRCDELETMRFEEVVHDCLEGRLEAGLEQVLGGQTGTGLPGQMRSKEGNWQAVRVRLDFVRQDEDFLLIALVQTQCNGSAGDLPYEGAATRDYLTGLPTRAALTRRLRRVAVKARRTGGQYAVLFIDVDRFKSINDTVGHRAGDMVLRAFGRRLRACVRPGDFVARYGGDEFVAVIDDMRSEEDVAPMVERIRAELSVPIKVLGRSLQVTASVGTAIGGGDLMAQDLLDVADRSMYDAKRSAATSPAAPRSAPIALCG